VTLGMTTRAKPVDPAPTLAAIGTYGPCPSCGSPRHDCPADYARCLYRWHKSDDAVSRIIRDGLHFHDDGMPCVIDHAPTHQEALF
jgi:hypothetical protein